MGLPEFQYLLARPLLPPKQNETLALQFKRWLYLTEFKLLRHKFKILNCVGLGVALLRLKPKQFKPQRAN